MDHLPPSITVDAYAVFVTTEKGKEMVDCFPDHNSAETMAESVSGKVEKKTLTLLSDGTVYLDLDNPNTIQSHRHRFEEVLNQKAVAALVGVSV